MLFLILAEISCSFQHFIENLFTLQTLAQCLIYPEKTLAEQQTKVASNISNEGIKVI